MRTVVGFVLAVVTTITVAVAAQQLDKSNGVDVESIARLDALTRRLSFPPDDREAQARFYRDVQSVTGQVRSLVDGYIRAAINPSVGSESAQRQLQTLLAHRKPNPDYASLPFARVADLAAGRSLLAAYTIVRGPHHDSATIRGFRVDPTNHFTLVATAGEEFGDDFTGYNLFTRELPSFAAGQLWLLAWGTQHTFNGTKMHFRLYAFDGQLFRTVWGPDDMFDAQVEFTRRGLSIEHLIREPSRYTVRDDYELTSNGPQLAASTVIGATQSFRRRSLSSRSAE
jgi:hypothetical protein